MKKKYYLPFLPAADINYLYLFALYDLAEYQTDTGAYNTIYFTSKTALAKQIGLSLSTVSRIFNSGKYDDFFLLDNKGKTVVIKNDFRTGTGRAFVMLTAAEVSLIRKYNDNLFAKYFIYLKYYCGHSKNKKSDFTAKQFLMACGYSTVSNSYVSKISDYNRILLDNDIIRIEKYCDELGHTRNRYSFI